MLNQRFGFINEVLLGGADIRWLDQPVAGQAVDPGRSTSGSASRTCSSSAPARCSRSRRTTIEAARIDGAGAWRIFRSMTLPLLMVSVAPLLIASFAFNFNNFTLIYMLTGGGPNFVGHTGRGGPHGHPHLDGLLGGLREREQAVRPGERPVDPHLHRGRRRSPTSASAGPASSRRSEMASTVRGPRDRRHRRGARPAPARAPLVGRDRLAARRRHRDDRRLRRCRWSTSCPRR